MQIVIADVQVRQDAKGRFSLNDFHRAAGGEKRHQPSDWLRLDQTRELVAELENSGDSRNKAVAVQTGRNGGTYAAKELIYAYAMWISPAFNLKVIRTFDAAANGQVDWKKLRHGAASSNKVVNAVLQEARKAIGKDTAAYHYMNEARLVNSLLSGEYRGIDRDTLSAGELDLLSHLELRNAVLIGQGFTYEQRKTVLRAAALDWRLLHAEALPELATPTPAELAEREV